MNHLRVSVTDLDQFYRYETTDSIELDDLMVRLTQRDEPSEPMKMGTAFHSFLERAIAGTHSLTEPIDGYVFTFEREMAVTLPAIREMRCTHVQMVGDIAVTISGRIDACDAITVHDHKLTGYFDLDRYTDSYQWRLYLWMLGKHRFLYNVFTRGEPEPGEVMGADWSRSNPVVTRATLVPVNACDVVPLYGYPRMAHDVIDLVARYAHFARQHRPETILCT